MAAGDVTDPAGQGGARRDPIGRRALRRAGLLLASADMARAYTVAAFAAVVGSVLLIRISSQVTYVTVIIGLCLVGGGILAARRRELSLLRLVPVSLVLFAGWAAASMLWTTSRTQTALGWLSLAGIALIAVVIGHVRDTLQTARALGDAMRVALSVSLGLEILSGVLLDMPFPVFGITGAIADGGPIQGIFGTRNLLGFVTVVALITFVIEWRTASVRPGTALYSVIVAGALAVLSDSPTVLVLAIAVAAATGVLAAVRHAAPHRRPALQWTLGAVVAAVLIAAYALRDLITQWLGAGTDFSMRTDLWHTSLELMQVKPIAGWGWFGPWSDAVFPFTAINYIAGDHHQSALNAFVDVMLQLGWVGFLLFAGLCGLALVRSWLAASERRAVVFAWTPLMLVALLVDSMFESFTLIGFGWLILVVCAVRASASRSWRDRMDAVPFDEPDAAAGGLPHSA